MNRGEVWRSRERHPERGHKPGFYVVVSRQFIVENGDVSTVICAPVYSEILGLSTEVVIGEEEGLARTSAVRCDFLALLFKSRLFSRVGSLAPGRMSQLDRALGLALDLPAPH